VKKPTGKDLFAERLKAINKPARAQPIHPPATAQPTKPARAPRQTVFRNATILFASGERMAVVIKDLSATGARVEFVARVDLPPEATLIDITGRRRQVRVVWQREGAAGIEFIGVTPAASP
jgi:hypothetical protein